MQTYERAVEPLANIILIGLLFTGGLRFISIIAKTYVTLATRILALAMQIN